jgi:hypothetical protein
VSPQEAFDGGYLLGREEAVIDFEYLDCGIEARLRGAEFARLKLCEALSEIALGLLGGIMIWRLSNGMRRPQLEE